MKLHSTPQILAMARAMAVTGALALLPAMAIEYDLSPTGSQSFNVVGDFGGTAIVADFWSQPTGTGVFNPFLTLDGNGQTSTGSNYVEQAYNADGFNQLYLDGLRPNWNTTLKFGDLASINIAGINYFGFILDANEPGSGKSLISVDNIRIYTSATDNTANVGDDTTKLNSLGTLRWAMNDPLRKAGQQNGTAANTFDVDNWIKLDAGQENINKGSNGGSGMADMIVYIPQAAFGNAAATDFVWFYNLNGVHYSSNPNFGSTAGFEEWSAVQGPQVRVPDGGNMLSALAMALLGLIAWSRRRLSN